MGAGKGIALAAAALLIAAVAASPASAEPGQIYVADREGFGVYASDPFDGGFTPIESGFFGDLRDVTVAPTGTLFMADSGDLSAGAMAAVFSKTPPGGPLGAVVSGPPLITPAAVEFDHAGRLLVGDADAAAPGAAGRGLVARYDLATGARTIIAAGPPFRRPSGIASAPSGEVFVSDEAPAGGVSGAVFRISRTGAVTSVHSGPPLGSPAGLAREPDGSLVTTDTETAAVYRLDPSTGGLTTVWAGPPLSEPSGIAVLPDRSLLVPDGDGPTGRGALWRIPPGSPPVAVLAGDESIFSGPVAVTVDPPRCPLQRATIVGTTGPDVLVGSPGPDVIAALDGADRVLAGGGADVVCGGEGKDLLKGQGGIDVLFGLKGRDRLVGGKGRRDRCVGGAGNDLRDTCERGRG